MTGRILAVALVAGTTTACKLPLSGEVCAGLGFNAVIVKVRDQAGNARAYGSTVTVADVKDPYVDVRIEADDSLTFNAVPDRTGGTYRVIVTKPHYANAVIENVVTPYEECVTTNISVVVPAMLTLLPGAPPVRSFVLIPRGAYIDRPPRSSTLTFVPRFDADLGANTAVTWSITGDTASVFFDPVLGKVTYRCRTLNGRVFVRARSVADTTLTDVMRVDVQGHPDGTNDLPC